MNFDQQLEKDTWIPIYTYNILNDLMLFIHGAWYMINNLK